MLTDSRVTRSLASVGGDLAAPHGQDGRLLEHLSGSREEHYGGPGGGHADQPVRRHQVTAVLADGCSVVMLLAGCQYRHETTIRIHCLLASHDIMCTDTTDSQLDRQTTPSYCFTSFDFPGMKCSRRIYRCRTRTNTCAKSRVGALWREA